MSIRLSTGLRNMLLGTASFKDVFADGVIHIYSGPQPATADAAVSGTLLGIVTVDGGAFSFGSPTNGLEFDAPSGGAISKAAAENWKFTGLANGQAGWGRLMGNALDALGESTTLARLDFSIGTYGADLVLANVNITTGAPNTIDVFSFSLSASAS